jgi:hypothetical protein
MIFYESITLYILDFQKIIFEMVLNPHTEEMSEHVCEMVTQYIMVFVSSLKSH